MAIRISNKQLNAIVLAGQQLSNICFNLAQRDTLPAHERQSMKECVENWDLIKPRKRIAARVK